MNLIARTFLCSAALVAALCGTGRVHAASPQPVGGRIDWVFDYAQGKRLADSAGKPMLVVFRCER